LEFTKKKVIRISEIKDTFFIPPCLIKLSLTWQV